jgi:peptidoglycan/xylan/chitin deacetylase (PgdA/CDA1 family)
MKKSAASLIRLVHAKLSLKQLPERLAIYFHELDERQQGAFGEAIDYFMERGYRTCTPAQFVHAEPGRRSLFISFDDNFQTWRRALPALESACAQATFYVNTLPFRDTCSGPEIARYFERIGYRGPASTLTRQELCELRSAGHKIGCHSHSHYRLSALPRARWDDEIRASKADLEDLLGEPLTDFSYPYGMRRHFSHALRSYCAQIGFKTIATAIPGMQHTSNRDQLAIHRTRWRLDAPLEDNIADLRIDGALFEKLTGRSAVG